MSVAGNGQECLYGESVCLHRQDRRDSKADKAVYEDRLAVCKECKYLNEGLCGACGCFVELRAVIAVNRCPYEKW